jgi:hypothetical protein
MTQNPYLFDIDSLIQARLEFIREARAHPPGAERNQKRQVARSLKRLVERQMKTQNYSPRLASKH